MFFAVQSLPPSSAERTQRVAMYCNYDEISSLKLQAPDDFIFELFGPCELFPEGWRVREEPTVGFKLLCSVLSIPIAPIIFTINGRPMKVVSKLVEEPDFSIYRIEINGQEYAAKKGSTLLDGRPAWKHASDTIHSEIRKLSILKDIVDLQPFILTPLWEYTSISESVLVMPFGEDLHMWWGVNMSFSADIVIPNDLLVLRLQKFYRFISNIFSGLVVLHKNDWVHADIRPKNILIVDNNSARLIDWATAHHKIAGLSMHFLHQGAVDPFMPDELYQEFHQQPPCTLFPAKWDFISLAYCIFGLTGLFDGLPSTDQKEFLQVRGLRIENVREPLEGEIPFRTELNLWAKQFWAVANSVDNYPNEEQVARMRAVIEAKVI